MKSIGEEMKKKIEMFCMFSLIKYLFSVSFSNVVCG